MSRRTFYLRGALRGQALEAVRNAKDGSILELREPTRTLPQNSRFWAMLTDISNQLWWEDWRGEKTKMSPEEWKHFFVGVFSKEQRMVKAPNGAGLVLVGGSSKLTVTEMGELMTFMEAFGAERGVVFFTHNVVEREEGKPNA